MLAGRMRTLRSMQLGLAGQLLACSAGCGPSPGFMFRCAPSAFEPRSQPLCRVQTADISAQNLGDEGFAYVVDALSFNDKSVRRSVLLLSLGAAAARLLCASWQPRTNAFVASAGCWLQGACCGCPRASARALHVDVALELLLHWLFVQVRGGRFL